MSEALNVTRPQEILAELRRLGMHVAMFNLIVFIDDPQRRAWVHERAARIAEKHPSRLIILDACDESGGAVVSPSALYLRVGKLGAPEIVHLTRELSAPDAPRVLWWSSERLIEHDAFPELFEQSDHVVMDSSGARDDESTLQRLLCFVQPLKPLQDLAWMRSAPWREMIAQLFDDPETREDLSSLSALEITSGSTAEALYLAAWLAGRLGWKPEHPRAFRTPEGSRITLETIDKGEKRRVVRVAAATKDSRYTAQLSDDESVVELSVEGAKSKPAWFVPLQNIDNASLVEQAIITNTTDDIYNESLHILRELLT